MVEHTIQITIPFGELGIMLDWCKSNIQHDWHLANLDIGGEQAGHYIVSFTDENDYNFFAMKWL